ncbi:PIN domain-containing protein [Streptomyces sioyaensis]|uniref:PIN domain-containing protein n=1 Tax=Streptomyces sioyaensis TaxID=67364 RepID=UPI0037B5A26B
MIILDTCILRECGLGGSSADLLRSIRAVGAQGVAVPWMVMEELAAQKAVKYTQKYEAAVRAFDALKEASPWESVRPLEPSAPEQVREHCREEWRSVVDIIPTSESALREAAFREANGLAPCKTQEGGKSAKTGFRDAAIWMSAVEYARANADETVYFVSSNTKDFGDGQRESYRDSMSQDIKQLGDRFVHLTSLDDVIGRFTLHTDADEKLALKVIKSEAACKAAAVAAWGTTAAPFRCTISLGSLGETHLATVLQWMNEPRAIVDSVKDIEAFRIGQQEWCTATTRWFLWGSAITRGATHLVSAGCAWEARVLFSLSPGSAEPRLTILRSQAPEQIPTSDFDRLQTAARAPERLPEFSDAQWGAAQTEKLLNALTNDKSPASALRCTTCDTYNPRQHVQCIVCDSVL